MIRSPNFSAVNLSSIDQMATCDICGAAICILRVKNAEENMLKHLNWHRENFPQK